MSYLKNSFFKSISKQENKVLSLYQKQLHQQKLLLGIVKSALPLALREHADYCVITQNKVLLYTKSAVWASQLRFYTTVMLEAIQAWQNHAAFESLQIRLLDPTSSMRPKESRQANIPSETIIKYIRDTRTPNQDNLNHALMSLSNTLSNKAHQAKKNS